MDKLDPGERDLDLREFKEDLSKLCEGEGDRDRGLFAVTLDFLQSDNNISLLDSLFGLSLSKYASLVPT